MTRRTTVHGQHGMIATSQPLATETGLAILRRGGNAVDAAVSAAAVLGVTEPMMTGIGGDMFALVWLAAEQRLVGINASGRSGSRMSLAALRDAGHGEVPRRGAPSITVPGALLGWQDLLNAHGTLSLAAALQPAIAIARDGFPVMPAAAAFWRDSAALLAGDAGARATFLLDGHRPPAPGELFRTPDLARTLSTIARDGPEAFYTGTLGRAIAAHVKALGGFLTAADLAGQQSEWVDPVAADYRGVRIYEAPPNSQGIAVLEMLRILEAFDLEAMGAGSAAWLHHLIEAKKLAFADLEYFVGDPAAMTVGAPELCADDFIAQRRTLLDPACAVSRPQPGAALTSGDTTYLAVGDADGNMVSFINSISNPFGSGVVVPGTGFLLQNRGAGFTMTEGLANTVAPRKRPFHTITPAFVTRPDRSGRQQPWLSLGVVGDSMQPQGQVQVLSNIIDFDMDLQQALDAPRFRHLDGNRVALEDAIPPATRAALVAMGHEPADPAETFMGGAQVIARTATGWAAATEPRLDGVAAGYQPPPG